MIEGITSPSTASEEWPEALAVTSANVIARRAGTRWRRWCADHNNQAPIANSKPPIAYLMGPHLAATAGRSRHDRLPTLAI